MDSRWCLLPERSKRARLIVCERKGWWAAAMRAEVPPSLLRAYETRTLNECWSMLGRCPASFLVVELTASGAEDLVERTARLDGEFPLARLAVVADRSLSAWEDVVRSAGAIHFATSPREAKQLAEIAMRHLAAAPERPTSIATEIWDRLPWGRDD